MTRMLKVIICCFFVGIVTLAVQAQSVGDAARENAKTQKSRASKTYTNEDIPSAPEPAPVEKKKADASADASEPKEGDTAEGAKGAAGEKSQDNADATASDNDDSKKKAAEESAQDSSKVEREWKDKVTAQKEKVATLEKERELSDREYKLRAAVFYADAGNRLRDDKRWADAEQKYKADSAKLEQDLKSAKEELESLRERARKAGVKVE